jgi:hypothetical protein
MAHEANTVHDIGDQPLIRGWFTVDDTPTDPDTVVARYHKPSGAEGALVAVQELTGQWSARFPSLDEHGWWTGRIGGTSGVIAYAEVSFYCRPTKFTNP